jgi:8-oxo-dGTP pyrophosphatase MutT (NUDIX family)
MNEVFAAFVVACTEGGFAATTRPDLLEKFGLPGGKLEAGESPLEAAIREAAEEGWLVSGINPMPIQAYVLDGKLVLWFTATTAVRLSVYKEQGRITPVVISREMLLASGFGNGELKL